MYIRQKEQRIGSLVLNSEDNLTYVVVSNKHPNNKNTVNALRLKLISNDRIIQSTNVLRIGDYEFSSDKFSVVIDCENLDVLDISKIEYVDSFLGVKSIPDSILWSAISKAIEGKCGVTPELHTRGNIVEIDLEEYSIGNENYTKTPCLIISNNMSNLLLSTLIVIPLAKNTNSNSNSSTTKDNVVYLGDELDYIIKTNQIRTVSKMDIIEESGVLLSINKDTLQEVMKNLSVLLSLEE